MTFRVDSWPASLIIILIFLLTYPICRSQGLTGETKQRCGWRKQGTCRYHTLSFPPASQRSCGHLLKCYDIIYGDERYCFNSHEPWALDTQNLRSWCISTGGGIYRRIDSIRWQGLWSFPRYLSDCGGTDGPTQFDPPM
ncbi:hypothetical protein BC832DRAFT_454594 [Gaertneriomyces semiglobifer]|nr:hypothetical protein BC832DRAFT_454594 [Gaertneriomyces semiglobifer]